MYIYEWNHLTLSFWGGAENLSEDLGYLQFRSARSKANQLAILTVRQVPSNSFFLDTVDELRIFFCVLRRLMVLRFNF